MLASSVSGGVWSSANTSIATVDAAGMVAGVAAGTVHISYTVSNSCGAVSAAKLVAVLSASGVEHVPGAGKLSIYPNPATGAFHVDAQTDGYLYLFSMDGRQVARYKIVNGSNYVNMPAGLAPGIYPGKFMGDDGVTEQVKIMYQP